MAISFTFLIEVSCGQTIIVDLDYPDVWAAPLPCVGSYCGRFTAKDRTPSRQLDRTRSRHQSAPSCASSANNQHMIAVSNGHQMANNIFRALGRFRMFRPIIDQKALWPTDNYALLTCIIFGH